MNDADKVLIKVQCNQCGQIFKIYMFPEDIDLIKEDYLNIAQIDYLTDEERMLLSSHMCQDCFDENFL